MRWLAPLLFSALAIWIWVRARREQLPERALRHSRLAMSLLLFAVTWGFAGVVYGILATFGDLAENPHSSRYRRVIEAFFILLSCMAVPALTAIALVRGSQKR